MVGRLTTIFCIAGFSLMNTPAVFAQHISVGVTAGVPFTGGLSDFTTPSNVLNQVTHTYSNSHQYIVGPMIEVRLPLNLAIEADALYRPINTATNVIATTGSSQVMFQSSVNVATWEFPVLGKYRFPFPIVKPYIEAGPSFRKAGSDLSYISGKGFTLGGGIEVKILKLRIAPELRYTHWGSDSPPPISSSFFAPSNGNQGEFLVGFSF
jgi:hypothetical protein